MLMTCLDAEAFLRLVVEAGLVVMHNRFVFTKSGKFITEIDRDMLIPDRFFWLIKKAIETQPDLLDGILIPRETSKMKQWELVGPSSER